MLLYGNDDLVAEWVGLHLCRDADSFKPSKAIGIIRDGKIVAGVVYNNYQPNILIEMTIASIDKRWATRHNLKALFSYPFTQLNVGRVQAMCSENNEGVQMFLERLGFTHEGTHRAAYLDGGNAMSYGMLKHECRWL